MENGDDYFLLMFIYALRHNAQDGTRDVKSCVF